MPTWWQREQVIHRKATAWFAGSVLANHGGMGIRYYAYPLRSESVALALEDPGAFMSRDPLADAWELDGIQRPEMLYLDKCWSLLQLLTRPEFGPPRTSYRLFEGEVTHTNRGWLPWIRVLTVEEVDAVARDLALLGERDVDELLDHRGLYFREGRASERSYIIGYLGAAQEFTALMQMRGWGLVYLIG